MYMYNHIYTHMHTRVHANSHFLIQLQIFGRVHLVSIIALSSDVIPNLYAWCGFNAVAHAQSQCN